jgi:hypothetical protein
MNADRHGLPEVPLFEFTAYLPRRQHSNVMARAGIDFIDSFLSHVENRLEHSYG